MAISGLVTDEQVRDFVVASMTWPSNYGRGNSDLFVTWGRTPFGWTRDSGVEEQSNGERIFEDMKAAFGDDVALQRDRSQLCGWLETVIIRVLIERPAQPPHKLYGPALARWEASWKYHEADVKALNGAVLHTWLKTRVTPAVVRAAEIAQRLVNNPVYDQDDVSRRERDRMLEHLFDAWRELRLNWQDWHDDEDYEDDYDGPALPEDAPTNQGGPFGLAYEVFRDRWLDSDGAFRPTIDELKEAIKENDDYRDWVREQAQVTSQQELFTAGEGNGSA